MGENFAFFLPVMMASFGVVFAFVWTLGIRAAGYWSAAYLCVAGGFAVPAGFALLPTPLWGFVADLLFASGFLLFSQALLERWRPNWLLRARIAIWALSVLLCAMSLLLDNLPFELVSSDFGCFLLIGLPLIAGRDRLDNWSDGTLFGAAALVALDNLMRGSTVPLTLSSDSFLNSDYAFLMQALACVLGLFLALAALAANMLDLLAHYRRDALHDPLSGLLNRRGFDDAIGQRTRKLPTQGSLIVCDIDHFKTINDAHGHALGDRVIVALARILMEFAPADAITARFGGEEFIMFLPDADAARAATTANDIRESVAREVASQLGLSRPLTASFGLSAVQPGDAAIHDAIARADAALYEAKMHGRNRVCVRRALAVPDAPAAILKSRARSG
ncbi:diguanylate cyclase [Sphingobium indicum IP26]|uniref:diguanylate cyclase n=1 Tax=Sphingobium indicum F2 TaxID=1450518 RepID=A0A8E0WWA8_9SPHN|nr:MULTISPECIES: GGDEF domain-containing protein [Sphingobium]EPR09131.1 diguanylate cyclase [Sphingobium indicum IP26]EQB06797.1 diguanylate cyclase [Sphingobium sp. HDIP04]KER38370.1 diguanylate cyclase [Sphingobium indicum F2]